MEEKNEIEFGPQPGPQTEFLECEADVAIYGGAAGGGKTYAILLDFIRHYDNGEAGAVCFRRTSKQVTSEGGLWDTASKIYPYLNARPRQSKEMDWTFPSGCALSFAHLEHEKNVHDWQGSQIPVIYFDELTHFTERQFWYMITRNRSTSGIHPYVRATTNPDSRSWVRKLIDWWIGPDGFAIPERSGVIRWFVRIDDKLVWSDTKEELQKRFPEQLPKSFTFIPSKLEDNKILMKKDPSYKANLMAQSKVERERLLNGNWNIEPKSGMFFRRDFFEEVDAHPPLKKVVRCWDRAATEWNEGDSGDPDFTVGLKLGQCHLGQFYILDIVRVRRSALKVEQIIKNTAKQDGVSVVVKGFQDPGSAGKNEIENFVRMLAGYQVEVEKISNDKITSAKAASAQAEAGNVKVLSTCRHKEDLYSEMENFPEASHDDIVDAFTGAFNWITLESAGRWGDDEGELNGDTNLIDNDLKW